MPARSSISPAQHADQRAALLALEDALLHTVGIPVECGEAPGPDGARLHYLTCGEGEPLVLLHGRGSAGALFAPVLADLAARQRVITLDLPGWGLSDKPAFTGHTAQDALNWWSDGVIALLDHLGLDSVDLLGHAMGGFTALGVALAHPARVRRLILADAGGLGRETALDMRLYFWLKPERLHRWLGKRITAHMLALDGSGRASQRDATFDFTWAITTQRDVIPSGARAFDHWVSLMGVHLDLLNRLREIEQPTLMLWGERDHLTPYANALRARKLLRSGRLVAFTKCGHSPFVERPTDFARVVNVWLNGGGAPSRV